VLVLEDFVVEREMVSEELRDAIQLWYPEPPEPTVKTNSSVYAFV
jgi:hypothetical protein